MEQSLREENVKFYLLNDVMQLHLSAGELVSRSHNQHDIRFKKKQKKKDDQTQIKSNVGRVDNREVRVHNNWNGDRPRLHTSRRTSQGFNSALPITHTHAHTPPSQPHPCAVIGPKFYGRRPRLHGSALPALCCLLLPNQLADLTAGPAGYCNVGRCLPFKVRLVHFSCGGLSLKPSWLNCQERTFLCAACDSGCPSQRLNSPHFLCIMSLCSS